jgi:hypothetical protein
MPAVMAAQVDNVKIVVGLGHGLLYPIPRLLYLLRVWFRVDTIYFFCSSMTTDISRRD